MSDQPFPMPKTVGDQRPGGFEATPPAPRDYAPKRANHTGLEAVADAIQQTPEHLSKGRPYTPPPSDYKGPRHQDAIRDSLKKLTHREMRELVGAIFAAHKKIGDGDTITLANMPDVLDAFAYGD